MVFKSIHHQSREELMTTFAELQNYYMPLVNNIYEDIKTTLNHSSYPSIAIRLSEIDMVIPFDGYSCSPVISRNVVITMTTLHEQCYQAGLKLNLNDMDQLLRGEITHTLLLAIAKYDCDFSQYGTCIGAYNYVTENCAWNILYPIVNARLRQKFKVKMELQALYSIAGIIYTKPYKTTTELLRVFTAIASLICRTPDEMGQMVNTFTQATRFVLNINVNDKSFPGLLLVDNTIPYKETIEQANTILATNLGMMHEFGFRINQYGIDNKDITLTFNMFTGYRHPFIKIPANKEPRG